MPEVILLLSTCAGAAVWREVAPSECVMLDSGAWAPQPNRVSAAEREAASLSDGFIATGMPVQEFIVR